jgi:hypothetical protein
MHRRAFALVWGLLLSGCGPLTFSTQVKGSGTVQGSPLGALVSVFPSLSSFTNIDFNQNQDFKNNNASRDHVLHVKVTQLTLQVTSPTDQDFSFLDSVAFAASANGQQVVIAQKSGIAALNLAAPTPTLTLDLTDVDLADEVKADAMSIVLSGRGHQPPKDTTLEASVKLDVAVKL